LADSDIGQDVRECDCDPICGTVMTFSLRDWVNPRTPHVIPYRDRDSTRRFTSWVNLLFAVLADN